MISIFRSFSTWLYFFKSLKLEKNEFGFICPFGIGDTYLVCSLLEHLLIRNKKKFVKIFVKKKHKDIAELFKNSKIRIKVVNMPNNKFFKLLALLPKKRSILRPGHITIAHPGFIRGTSWNKIGKGNTNFLKTWQEFFGLDINCKPSLPLVTYTLKHQAMQRCLKLGLKKNKTIILAPEANSFKNFNLQFWQTVADSFKKRGFTVCLLSITRKLELKGTKLISFPLGEALPIAKYCGLVISTRSGLCDLLSTAKANICIIYSGYTNLLYRDFSLRDLSKGRGRILEFEVDEDSSIEITVSRIIKAIFSSKANKYI